MTSIIDIIRKIRACGAGIKINGNTIKINAELTKFNFSAGKNFLYSLLNKFEKSHFIIITGMPYCLMPDALEHIIYQADKNTSYAKDKECKGCKQENTCPGWPNECKTNKNLRPSKIIDAPKEIIIELTQKCNMNCLLCFSRKDSKELSLSKIKSTINECSLLGIKAIRFTGGEPLLYKKLEEALCYAKNKNLYVMLNTNATILNPKIKAALNRNVDNVLVSLQGFNSQSEQILTGAKSNFKEKIKNIISLSSTIPVVRVGTIISRTLINNFSKYSYLIKDLGIKIWELYRPMSDNENGEFMINRRDFLKIMRKISSLKHEGLDAKIANPIPFCITRDLNLSKDVLLGAEADDGHSRIVFDAGGFFKPSYFINKNLGINIGKAWDSPFLKRMRSLSYLHNKCKICFYLKWCKGGSRYWANVINEGYFGSDPLMGLA